MKINRSLKVRIYPNQRQQIQINKTLGCCRFLYNQMLSERIQTYEKLKDDKIALYKYKHKTEKEYKREYEWLKEVDSTALQQSRRDLSAAYQNFFKSLKGTRKGQKIGFPKFRKKKHTSSYRTVMGSSISLDNKTIKVLKIEPIKFKCKGIKSWYYTAEAKSITITKINSGKYYASILFENEQDFIGHQEIKSNARILGLDMSLDKFYVDQYGNSPEYKKYYRSNKKLAKIQRSYSRKINGSNNKEKARIKLATVHEYIVNQRLDFVDKLSDKLIKENDVIIVENLSLSGMKKSMNFGKSISDLGYSIFINKLKYKALWNDKTLVQADRWFASSKTCSVCGYVKKDLLLQERKWICTVCGTHLNRDQNAGQNLTNYGIKILGLG